MAINKIVTSAEIEAKNIGLVAQLTTTAKDNLVNSINEVATELGDVATLTTTDKSNVVAAVNEVKTSVDTQVNNKLNNLAIRTIAQADYDKLAENDKNNGILYAIEATATTN